MRKDEVLAATTAHVAPHRVAVWDAFGTQLVMGRREGYRMWDLSGHELMDFHLNGGTFNLGHRNPEVIASLVAALAEVDIGNHHFASSARAQLAVRLAETAPGDLTYCVFASGGSEAVDVAIKTARHATSHRRIVGLDAGYHGKTGLSGAAGADAGARFFLSDQPDDFATVPFADLAALDRALAAGGVAAVIMETIPATYGFPLVPDGYLPGVKALCEQHGALYIADEVQAGLGRTGDLWGVETYGVEPDLLVTGKGLSGGIYPIAATLISSASAAWLHEYGWGHVSTFGGSELGWRVADHARRIPAGPLEPGRPHPSLTVQTHLRHQPTKRLPGSEILRLLQRLAALPAQQAHLPLASLGRHGDDDGPVRGLHRRRGGDAGVGERLHPGELAADHAGGAIARAVDA